jgi:hypothetical protein
MSVPNGAQNAFPSGLPSIRPCPVLSQTKHADREVGRKQSAEFLSLKNLERQAFVLQAS